MKLKRTVSSCWQKVSSDGDALIVGGRSFHALGAVAGKARSPSVARRVDGTTGDTVLAERTLDVPTVQRMSVATCMFPYSAVLEICAHI